MKVDKELLEHVASLARLKLNDSEIKKFLPQLKEILEVFSKLDEVNTDNVEPSFQPVELKNVTREDKEKECYKKKDVLELIEHKKEGYFKGPRAV